MKKILFGLCLFVPLLANAQIPECSDSLIENALKKLFKQPSTNGGLHLAIDRFQQTKETAFYPKAKIKLCHSIAVAKKKHFAIDYNISVSGKQFFVQIENAQEIGRK